MKWILSVLIVIYFVSCSPDRDKPPPPAPPTDSLGGWQKIPTSITSALDIVFVNPAKGYLAGRGLYESLDSGKTWKLLQSVANGNVTTINFMNSQNGYFVGDNYGFTINSGNNWTTLNTSNGAIDVYFTSTTVGCKAGTNGIDRTVDTGRTWTRVLSQPMSSLNFVDANNGWAGGSNKIFKTENGGVTWVETHTGTYGDVYAIQFTNANNGWFVGLGDNAIYKTTNAGNNWQRIPIAGSPYDLHFINDNLGYVVTAGGTILKTTNGGNSWTQDAKVVGGVFIEVFFLDANHGWAVTLNGTVLRWKR